MSEAQDVAEFWENGLKRRAYADGFDAYTTGAGNPYSDVTARSQWLSGFEAAKRCDKEGR